MPKQKNGKSQTKKIMVMAKENAIKTNSIPRNITNKRSRIDKAKICDAICSQIDPFCASACGARVYDSSSTPSIPITFKGVTTVAQYGIGSGLGATQFKACVAECYRPANAGAASAFGTWVALPGYSSSNFSGFRVVSFGVHCFTISSPATSDGVVGALENMGEPPDAIDLYTTLAPEVYRDTRYDAEFTWTSKAEGPESQIYHALTSTDPAGWSSLTALGTFLSVQNSEAFLFCEVVLNCEVHAFEGTTYTNLMSDPKSANTDLAAIAANVSKKLPSVQQGNPEKATKIVRSSVMDEVGRFVSFAAPYAVDALIAAL